MDGTASQSTGLLVPYFQGSVDEALNGGDDSMDGIARDTYANHFSAVSPYRSKVDAMLSAHAKIATDDNYHVIDQHQKRKWIINPNMDFNFYRECDQMRRTKTSHGISTRQGEPSRIFMDFDIVLNTSKSISAEAGMRRDLVR